MFNAFIQKITMELMGIITIIITVITLAVYKIKS